MAPLPRARPFPRRAALASACLLSACATAEIDETEHQAFFVDGRVRKQLDGADERSGPYLEVGWTSLQGSTGPLDYQISTATLGGGMQFPVGEQCHVGVGGGFAWQLNDLDTSVGTLDEENEFGLYIALEGGWFATSWLEPYARVSGMQAVDALSSTQQFDVGARLHLIEHAALFLGWRYVTYDIEDIDDLVNFSSVELDASGVVLGLDILF